MKPIGMGMAITTKVVYKGLCFTAKQANSSVALTKVGSPPSVWLAISTDGVNWRKYSIGEVITLAKSGDYVYFRAGVSGNGGFSSHANDYHKFTMSGVIAASGDITSLLNPGLENVTLSSFCYARLFYRCTSLVSAPELPATSIGSNCYEFMFYGCTSLVSAPELPATIVRPYSYRYMFCNCTSLVNAPELPSASNADNCYEYMFYGCSSLVNAPKKLYATYASGYLYRYMFYNCKSLVNAPEIFATKFSDAECFYYMFCGCTSLKSMNVNFTSWPTYSTVAWVKDVPASGTFYKPSALPSWWGIQFIPNGWTVVNKD